MLRERILRKIFLTTFIVFLLFVISSFTINSNISNIKVEYTSNFTNIYLLNENNYLQEVSIVINDDIEESINIIFNNLKNNNHNYYGLKGLIPKDAKINHLKIEDNILSIDFNQELLNVNSEKEEKIIESIIYSFLNLKGINGLRISIMNVPLTELPHSHISLDEILTKKFGINKQYYLNKLSDVQKVILYYYNHDNGNNYYIPITKYINSKDDKVKIIIDNLKNNYLSETNLMSYINDKVNLENYEYQNSMLTLSFISLSDLVPYDIKEEVIYTLASSIFDSTEIKKIIFKDNDHIIAIKDR